MYFLDASFYFPWVSLPAVCLKLRLVCLNLLASINIFRFRNTYMGPIRFKFYLIYICSLPLSFLLTSLGMFNTFSDYLHQSYWISGEETIMCTSHPLVCLMLFLYVWWNRYRTLHLFLLIREILRSSHV